MAGSETTQRLLVAAVGIPIAVGAVFVGGWVLAALILIAALLAAQELFRMAARKEAQPMGVLGATLAGAYVVAAAVAPETGPGAGYALVSLVGIIGLVSVAIWARGVEGQPLLSTSTTLTGAIYTGGLLSYGLFLRHLPGTTSAWHGTAIVFAPLLLTWASDTFAYFVGRAWGTRKLIPRVSPGKTLQGAIGAVVGTVLVAIGYGYVLELFPLYRLNLLEAAALGLIISISAQVGDLAESLFKRDTGVKDSGTLLPGHGGVLDRVDSLLFTLPIAYLFFRYVAGPQ